MRIYGNRRLETLPGRAIRPTPSRVREALFDHWQGQIQDCRWLDLCAGSGAMGAEALCRGASWVVGIEHSGRACGAIARNWQRLAPSPHAFQLLRGGVCERLPALAGQQFDRAYFDPPYGSGLYQPVLSAIAALELLAPNGELAVEYDPQAWEAASFGDLRLVRCKPYGSTALAFYRWS
jgi:16S rRNA (guanine(966)-N(2))-methyltransferase RsmD